MAARLDDLAARMRSAVEDRERDEAARVERERSEKAEKARREARARAEREAAERARDEMMGELASFADSLGFAKISKDLPRSLAIAWSGRELTLRAGEGDRIAVSGAAAGAHLTRDSVGEWEVVFPEGESTRRLPLDLGLEELLTMALDVPAPKGAARPVEAGAPAPAKDPSPLAAPPKAAPAGKKPAMMPGPSVKTYKGPFE